MNGQQDAILSRMTIVMGLLLLVMGCSSGALPTPGPAKGTFPTGTFGLSNWTWTFDSDGTFSAQGGRAEKGTYVVTGDQVVFKGDYCGENVLGTYTWSFDGTALVFRALADTCTDRRGIVESGRWKKQ